jgi:hypothetical protein
VQEEIAETDKINNSSNLNYPEARQIVFEEKV